MCFGRLLGDMEGRTWPIGEEDSGQGGERRKDGQICCQWLNCAAMHEEMEENELSVLVLKITVVVEAGNNRNKDHTLQGLTGGRWTCCCS